MLRRLLAASCCTLALATPVGAAGSMDSPRHRSPIPPWLRARLERIAWCESRGQWHIDTDNGFTGGLQFLDSTWHAMGGSGKAAWATKEEQMRRGARLYRITGGSAWPVCSRV
jgi:hypothetical protein